MSLTKALATPRLENQLELAKWLAIITMAIDHFGLLLAPQYAIFRLVGRFSLPLFLFVLAVRLAEKPQRGEGYLLRLSLWALISQLPFWFSILASHAPHDFFKLINIMATLGIGVALTLLVEDMKSKSILAQIPGWVAATALLLIALKCDYGPLAAVGIPVLSWLARRAPLYAALGCGVVAASANFWITWGHPQLLSWSISALVSSWIAYRCLASTAKPWRLPGWFFYAFYPVHFTLFYLIADWLR